MWRFRSGVVHRGLDEYGSERKGKEKETQLVLAAPEKTLLAVRHRFSVSYFRFVLQFPEACLHPGPVLAVSKNW